MASSQAQPQPSFEYKGIGSILKAGRLKVPINQREYSWEDKQVNDLIQDFNGAIRIKPTYFLGTIVLSKGSKQIPEVVDGQQRLATCSILLAAIRDYFESVNETATKTSIENDFLITFDREHKESVPKLSLNIDDNEYFRRRILSPTASSERQTVKGVRESHARIDSSANKAKALVAGIVRDNNPKNAGEILNEWINFIEDRVKVVLLTVPDELNAFMMFETLNDRGLKTSQADLVKNYLFQQAEDRIQEAQQKWARMVSILETLGIDEILMTYLRHFVVTQYGPTREKDIFQKIQDEVSGKTQSIVFLEKLTDYAESYAALLNPAHAKWNPYSAKVRDEISVLLTLKVQQIRPLMLAVAQNFARDETEKAFRSFIFWTVRFLISGGMSGGQLDEAYGLKANDVVAKKISASTDLAQSLRDVIPTDGDFEAAFTTARVSQHYLARYYLRAMEAQLRKETDRPELQPVVDTDILSLEHILPEEPMDKWPHFDDETAAAYAKRLGNMTLLRTKPNNDFGSAQFQTKRAELLKSELFLNKFICEITDEKSEWKVEDINKRQKWLAGVAVKTWPLAA